SFFRTSSYLQSAGLSTDAARLDFAGDRLVFGEVVVNAYFASVAADFLRQKLLEARISFTFETVMSSPDKVALLEKARSLGYRTYLFYVATEGPGINVSRVLTRIGQGGHPVPEDKIVRRYHRSLGLLMDALRRTNR